MTSTAIDPQTLPTPMDLDAERAVLGTMLMSADARAVALRWLRSDDFAEPEHARLFAFLADVIMPSLEEGEQPDLVTVASALKAADVLAEVGGQAYLVTLIESVPTVSNAPIYARIVREKSALRQAVKAGLSLAQQAAQPKASLASALEHFDKTTRRCRTEAEDSGPRVVLVHAADVEPKRLAYVWPGRIPQGMMTLFAGDPGLGKSCVALDLAARVSRGSPWPDLPLDGQGPPGRVIILSAEDDPAVIIRPRLEAAGADLGRVDILAGVEYGEGRGYFNLAADLPLLERALDARPDTRLIVVDPISAFLGKTDSHVNAEVRAALAPLADLAARRGVAVVAITHLTKAGAAKALHRPMGSVAFIATVRAAWHFAADPDNPARRFFLPAKANLGPMPTGLAYTIIGAEVSGVGQIARVVWERDPVTITADEVLAAEAEERAPARRQAEAWLRDRLADGPVPATEIQKEAQAKGIALRTLDRAKHSLGAEGMPDGFGKPWVWVLPDQSTPANA